MWSLPNAGRRFRCDRPTVSLQIMPWITREEREAWSHGQFRDSYRRLGAHPNRAGTWFCVWAPNAEMVSVIGDFNGWNTEAHPLKPVGDAPARFWEGFVRQAHPGHRYKFRIKRGAYQVDKSDPYGRSMEAPAVGGSALDGLSSIVTRSAFDWSDQEWMQGQMASHESRARLGPESIGKPISIYELHLGSWKRGEDGQFLSYRELAEPLSEYLLDMGFTHAEFMPVLEHPFYGSWGYQVSGYFSPTERYGSPDDFRFLVDHLHSKGIGVLLDWVPAHFATDPQGLSFFDGSTLYEYDDPLMRQHPDWGTLVFDYNKPGVRNFLISNALYWLDEFHVDGLRFDAVASMLYRNYSRDEFSPNRYGGNENLEAISLLKEINEAVFSIVPGAMMIAEESTAWPGVSRPTYDSGLGFLFKWNMGWMHDTLAFMKEDPIHRRYHMNELTFPLMYAFSEHFTLPLSHDEVVHGKGSLWDRQPGDAWQKAANLRLLYGHMFGHPGKKLLFMGGEFGQESEWNHDTQLDWGQALEPLHAGIQTWVRDLNRLYLERFALWNDEPDGFQWIDLSDSANSVTSYMRQSSEHVLVFVFNFTPVPRQGYRVGVPRARNLARGSEQ